MDLEKIGMFLLNSIMPLGSISFSSLIINMHIRIITV